MVTKPNPPYFLQEWIETFASASPEERPAAAVRWLDAYTSSMSKVVTAYVRLYLELDMLEVRQLVWAIPAGHSALQPNDGDNVTMRWMRNFFNIATPIMRDHGSTRNQELVRKMWLHPVHAVRTDALHAMLKNTHTKTRLSNDEESLMRSAAWDLADENGMSEESVDAAIRLTLWTMHDGARRIRGQSRHPLLNAVTAVEMALRDAGVRRTPYTDEDHLLMQHPLACAKVFMFVCQHGSLKSSPDESDTAFTCLQRWLPGSRSAITAAQSMGISYYQTLQHLVDDLRAPCARALPMDMQS